MGDLRLLLYWTHHSHHKIINMAQSSVEWLVNKMIYTKPTYDEIMSMYKFAKAMHKQEHEDAYIEGTRCVLEGWAWTIEGRKDMAEIHYKETFGKSEQ